MGPRGGSGGESSRNYSAIDTANKTSTSTSGAGASQNEIEINEFFEQLLKEINNRDVAAVNKHLEEIAKTLGAGIDCISRILFGGSVSKKTFVEGLSDIDALVVLKEADVKGLSPEKIQDNFYSLLKSRFPNTEIVKGNLAVTVKFQDYEVQLLPAIKDGDNLRIKSASNSGWSAPINTKAFSETLTKLNKMNDNKVVPAIKLAKSALDSMPEQYHLSGYHVEAMAVEAFANYNGRVTYYDMTKHLLSFAQNRVLRPINDVTGQSGTIDEYLGPGKSITRQKISNQIKDIVGRFSGTNAVSITKEFYK